MLLSENSLAPEANAVSDHHAQTTITHTGTIFFPLLSQQEFGICILMAARTSLAKLPTEERDQPLFVWTNFSDSSLSIKVSDGVHTWEGTLNGLQLKELAELRKMSLTPFLDETLKALTYSNTEEATYVYSARSCQAGGLEFIWKKLCDGVKFQLGSIYLTPAGAQAINQFLLNHSLDCVHDLGQEIKELEEKCEKLTSERQRALGDLRSCSTKLDTIENELYGKFKLILNEKKAKIRKLLESKSYLMDQNEEMQRQIWETKTFQDENEQEQSTVEASNKETPPTNHKRDVESLLCDAPNKLPSPPPTKRRVLKRGTKKGKVEIPQPPALELNLVNKTKNKKIDTEASLDSDELLNML